MINNIDMLRFLTFVRNDIFTYCDTVSLKKRGVVIALIRIEGANGRSLGRKLLIDYYLFFPVSFMVEMRAHKTHHH